jgi:hypothetical protein
MIEGVAYRQLVFFAIQFKFTKRNSVGEPANNTTKKRMWIKLVYRPVKSTYNIF